MLPLHRLRPPDPLVARLALQGRRAPPQQRHPTTFYLRYIAQRLTHPTTETKIVVRSHQTVPLGPLASPHQTHDHAPHHATLDEAGRVADQGHGWQRFTRFSTKKPVLYPAY